VFSFRGIRRFNEFKAENSIHFIINYIFLIFLFVFFFEHFREQIWNLYKSRETAFFNNNSLLFNIADILFFILCFYVTVLLFGLGRLSRQAYHKFKKTIFLIWFITSFYYAEYYMISGRVEFPRFKLYLVVGLLFGIIFFILFYFYNSKNIRAIYSKEDLAKYKL
jgi:hypothetical protein